jgi:hypothetical protein
MRPLSRETLAREAAARLAVSRLAEGGCAGQGTTWSELEQRHRRARTETAAREVVDEIRHDFCGGCPALLGCGQWAQVQRYTGLAAGAAYEAGVRKEATWAVGPPGRRRRAS